MKTIKLPKHLNNKIGCEFIVHIMPPAKNRITPESFNEPVQFTFEDKAETYVLYDYTRQPIREIPKHLVHLSHAMLTDEFYGYMYSTHSLHPSDDAGVYFFTIKP